MIVCVLLVSNSLGARQHPREFDTNNTLVCSSSQLAPTWDVKQSNNTHTIMFDPLNNITHSACYTVEMSVSAGDLTRNTLNKNHTANKHICLQGIGCVCIKSYPPEIMQPSSSTRATIVSAENQNGATIVKATFFFCHYYIVWGSNNAGKARG